MSKQEVINCNDGQALADAVAVEVVGWNIHEGEIFNSAYADNRSRVMDAVDWQPHLPTEKGKAQCWGLMHKYNMHVDCDKGLTTVFKHFTFDDLVRVEDENPQVAVLKAALLSVRSE